jgi:hypothetical protein
MLLDHSRLTFYFTKHPIKIILNSFLRHHQDQHHSRYHHTTHVTQIHHSPQATITTAHHNNKKFFEFPLLCCYQQLHNPQGAAPQ